MDTPRIGRGAGAPRKPRPERSKPAQGTIDWERGERAYVQVPGTTIETVAAELGCGTSAVARRCADHDWRSKRAKFQAEAMRSALEASLHNVKEGAERLRQFEHFEGTQLMLMVSRLRQQYIQCEPDGEVRILCSARELKDLAAATRDISGFCRLSLGLPTEIKATAPEQKPIQLQMAWVPSGLRAKADCQAGPAEIGTGPDA